MCRFRSERVPPRYGATEGALKYAHLNRFRTFGDQILPGCLDESCVAVACLFRAEERPRCAGCTFYVDAPAGPG